MTHSHQARPPSNIKQLERDFSHILMDSRDGDGSGLLSSRMFTRHTFVFTDGSRLYVTEQISSGLIDISYYNWVNVLGDNILSFHSEPHDLDPHYQTSTEPHHVHPPMVAKLTNRTRYSNMYHQELHTIMEHIFLSLVAAQKI